MENSNKLDQVIDKLNKMEITLATHTVLHEKNTEDLAEHIRRTNLLEADLAPIKTHVSNVTFAIKVVLYIFGSIGTIILGLKQLGLI